jgi:oligopeptide transport system substrate-binding protein
MYSFISKIISLSTIFCLAVVTTSCFQQNDEELSQMSLEQPTHPGYLRIPLNGIVTTIDPGLTNDLAHIEVTEQLFLGLTDFDPDTYEVLPELATDWNVSEDGSIYTFHLREDVKWTNGESVTAHDIVWAIKRNLLPETESKNAFTLYILKNAQAINKGQLKMSSDGQILDEYGNPDTKIASQLGVEAIDDYTVDFTLEHAAGYFPALASLWTYRPLPRKVVKQYGKNWIEPENIQTNGSYMLTDWNKGSYLYLEKNPDYYEADKVKIPKIHYYIVPESTLGLAMYEKDKLDILGGQAYLRLPQDDIPRIKSDPLLRQDIRISPQFCTELYGFNTQLPPMDNSLVRKAISAAIDKQILIDVVLKSYHTPAMTFTRPPIFGSVDPKEEVGIQFNPKQAKTWLAEAGYPNGQGFPKVVLLHQDNEAPRAIAKGVKTILKHYLNIEIEILELDFDSYLDRLFDRTQTPHIFRIGWCSDYPDANNWLNDVFHPDKGYNWIGWNNREFAELVDKAQYVFDPQERKLLYRRAEKILNETEAGIVPIYFASAEFLVKPWVKGWYNMAFGGQHIRYWSLGEN